MTPLVPGNAHRRLAILDTATLLPCYPEGVSLATHGNWPPQAANAGGSESSFLWLKRVLCPMRTDSVPSRIIPRGAKFQHLLVGSYAHHSSGPPECQTGRFLWQPVLGWFAST